MKYLVYSTFLLAVTLLYILFYSLLFRNRLKTKERMNLIKSSWEYMSDEDFEEDRDEGNNKKEKEKMEDKSNPYCYN